MIQQVVKVLEVWFVGANVFCNVDGVEVAAFQWARECSVEGGVVNI